MTLPARRSIASFDSATAMSTALARALQGRPFPHLGQSPLKAPLVYASGLLPLQLRRHVYAYITGSEGVPPPKLPDVNLEHVATWATEQYPARRYPAAVIGSSNGALTHLYAACGIPWMPQTWLVPVRRRWAEPNDVHGALRFGTRHAPRLLGANPDVALYDMHDPNQDALSASHMAYFRIKWRRLPRAYARFLRARLLPDAPIIVAHDQSRWPVTKVAERHCFQLGAQGGMNPEQYRALPGAPAPNSRAPEAEWGFDASLLEDIRTYAEEHHHPVIEVRYRHPQGPAAAVADVFTTWLKGHELTPQRLLVSSFIMMDPWQTIGTGSVPYWTYFPVDDAARALSDYLDGHAFDDIDIMLFNHGTRSHGLADVEVWEQLAHRARAQGRLLAVDRSAFPADFPTFARYAAALRRLPRVRRPPEPLQVDEALSGLRESPNVSVLG